MRKIIQITTGHYQDLDEVHTYTLIALCDDGSIWKLLSDYQGNASWKQILEIPEEDGAQRVF